MTEKFELNEVDAQRPMKQLLQLRETALQLGFQDDVDHWHEVIKARKAMENK